MNAIHYRGYSALIEFDPEDMILTGRVAGLRDVVGFHAEDAPGIKLAFEEAVDDYLEACAKIGKEPEKAYSGKVMLRVSPELHSRISRAAELSGKSINQWGEEALKRAVESNSKAA